MRIKKSITHPVRNRIIVTILVLAALVVGFMYVKGYGPFSRDNTVQTTPETSNTNKTNYNPPTKDQVADGAQTKQSVADNTPTTSTPSSSSTPLGIVITSDAAAGDTYAIRTIINTITSTGSCDLNMKSASGKVYTSSVGIQPLSSNSTCKGFTVPLSSLSRGEKWHVTITATSGSSTGSVEKDVAL